MQSTRKLALALGSLAILVTGSALAASPPGRAAGTSPAGSIRSTAPAEEATPPPARAVPDRIAFQGFVTDTSGDPVSGPVNYLFSLYSVASGGTALWSENQIGVLTIDGIFSVELGAVNPLDADDFDGTPLWLGIKVFGGVELAPRTELLTSPFAFHARTADNVPTVLGDLSDVSSAAPAVGEVLRYDGAQWAPGTVATGSDGDWNISGDNLTLGVPGNVGIGTAGLSAKLAVNAGTSPGVRITNTGSTSDFALYVRNTVGTTARFDSPSSTGSGYPSTPTAIWAEAAGTDNGGFFTADDGDALTARSDGTGSAIHGWDNSGLGLAGEFSGPVEITDDLTVGADTDIGGTLGAGSLDVSGNGVFDGTVRIGTTTTGQALVVGGNLYSTTGDFYAGATNGVINCGGGLLNALANVISDVVPTLNFATGDEDLYIDDVLEVGNQGYKPGGGTWAAVSDVRLKRDIRDFDDGLEAVLRINPIWYRYSEKSGISGDREYVGVAAQDMLEVAPFMVEEKPLGQVVREDAAGREQIVDRGERYLTYDSSALVYMLVNAVQEQQKMLDEQRQRIEDLERRVGAR